MIHLVCLSEGKELPQFQHFRSAKTSNKLLNAWGKIISAETLLDENMFVACMDYLSQKHQGTSVQVLSDIIFLLVKLWSFSYLQSIT